MKLQNFKQKSAAILLTMSPLSAFAAGPDLTPLTTAIDVSTVVVAILAVAVIGISFILAKGGASSVMNFIRTALR